MKIFVTGGTGFVGSHLAHRLAYSGHNVTVGGLNPEKTVLDLPPNVEAIKCDVTDPDTLNFEEFDTVIHLVGLSPLKKPSVPYEKVHFEGTENVLEECRSSDISRYIHMSALGAETDADTAYLRTKGEAERQVKDSELDWTVFRPSVIFGEGGQFLNFTESLLTPYLTFLPGGGRNRFQPIYVEDIADLFLEAVEDEKHIDQAYNIGGPEVLTLAEISKTVEKQKGRGLKVLPVPLIAVKYGLTLSEHLDFVPFGLDQYHSLKIDNTVQDNSLEQFHKNMGELITVREYLEGNE